MSVRIELHPDVEKIIKRFEEAGHSAYLVGGSLRDNILGRPAYDNDLTTSALPEETMALFSDMRVIPTGLKHGTVTLLTDKGMPIEVTTFRTDGTYSDSRHPDSVSFTRSLTEDLARRDFTVNAMAYAPESGLVDIFGGVDDLEARTIRCVGDPERRFSEDALRILRAFRFSAKLGFEIEDNTLRAALSVGHTLSRIARERVASELMKLLASPSPSRALELMSPLLPVVIPETVIDPSRIPLCDRLKPAPLPRLALLVHGGDAEGVAKGLRLSNKDKESLKRLASFTSERLPATEADARRLLASFGEASSDVLIAVDVYEVLSGRDLSHERATLKAQLELSPCLSLSSLAVSGGDLIKEGIAEGKRVGAILSELLDAVIEDPTLNSRDKLISLANKIEEKNN